LKANNYNYNLPSYLQLQLQLTVPSHNTVTYEADVSKQLKRADENNEHVKETAAISQTYKVHKIHHIRFDI